MENECCKNCFENPLKYRINKICTHFCHSVQPVMKNEKEKCKYCGATESNWVKYCSDCKQEFCYKCVDDHICHTTQPELPKNIYPEDLPIDIEKGKPYLVHPLPKWEEEFDKWWNDYFEGHKVKPNRGEIKSFISTLVKEAEKKGKNDEHTNMEQIIDAILEVEREKQAQARKEAIEEVLEAIPDWVDITVYGEKESLSELKHSLKSKFKL